MGIAFKELNGQKLSLKNDGQLELFFIGVGSAFALKNNQTNFLIIKGDKHIMVDFGMTGPKALNTTTNGLTPTDIECVLPTHSHADHIGGIECLGLMNRYVGIPFMKKPKMKLIINEEYQRVLWNFSLSGGLLLNEESAESGHQMQITDYFDIIRPKWKLFQPREVFELDYGNIHLELFRTNHIPEQSKSWEASFISYGICIDHKIFISGDTKFDPELIKMYKDCKYMFHDVQFFPGAVHAPLADLRTLPEDIKNKMFLMHYADNYEAQDITGFLGWTKQGVRYVFE